MTPLRSPARNVGENSVQLSFAGTEFHGFTPMNTTHKIQLNICAESIIFMLFVTLKSEVQATIRPLLENKDVSLRDRRA